MAFISDTLARVKPSATIAVTQKARDLKAKGRDIISLSVGEPDFDTPDNVKEAAIAAIRRGETKYTPVAGIVPLAGGHRQEVQARERPRLQADADDRGHRAASRSCSTPSWRRCNPGDEVVIPAPFWVSYPDMVLIAGGTPVIVQTSRSSRTSSCRRRISSAPSRRRTKWVLLNSPSNPSGAAYSRGPR